MTAALRYPAQDLTLTVDGQLPTTNLADAGTGCVDFTCTSDVGFLCSFIDLLPSGVMWDRHKAVAKEEIAEAGGIPENGLTCSSMVSLAVFMAQVLDHNVRDILGRYLRETRPHTAVDTLDDWLERYQWQDCYRSSCVPEFLSKISPYSVLDECNEPTYVPTDFPEDFERALRYGILQAATRFSRGVIRNLDGINFVIAPLGARIDPVPYPQVVQDYLDGVDAPCDPAVENCPKCFTDQVTFVVTSTGEFLPGAPTAESFCGDAPAPVSALQTYDNGIAPVDIYPAVIAAECFVRAMLPQECPNIIFRASDLIPNFDLTTSEMIVSDNTAFAPEFGTPAVQVVINNTGDDPTGPVTAVVQLPAGIVIDDLGTITGGGVYDGAANTVTWNFADFGAASAVAVGFETLVGLLAEGTLVTFDLTVVPTDYPELAFAQSITRTIQEELPDAILVTSIFDVSAGVDDIMTPGEQPVARATVRNSGTEGLGPATAIIYLPDPIEVEWRDDFLLTPGQVYDPVARTLTWTTPDVVPGSDNIFQVRFIVRAGIPSGTPLVTTFELIPDNPVYAPLSFSISVTDFAA